MLRRRSQWTSGPLDEQIPYPLQLALLFERDLTELGLTYCLLAWSRCLALHESSNYQASSSSCSMFTLSWYHKREVLLGLFCNVYKNSQYYLLRCLNISLRAAYRSVSLLTSYKSSHIIFNLPVSQIWALTVPPDFKVTFFVANSTPIVGAGFLGSEPFKYLNEYNHICAYWFKRQVFPTEASPTKITIQS